MLEEGAEGVRLMTVHAAKGLEFPVVILADMTANLAAYPTSTSTRRRDCARCGCSVHAVGIAGSRAGEGARAAEGVRVAYVAATRARDLLVVPAVGDGELDGWVAPLNKAIYPARGESRKSRCADGCPDFGESSALGWEDFTQYDPTCSLGCIHRRRRSRGGLVGSGDAASFRRDGCWTHTAGDFD